MIGFLKWLSYMTRFAFAVQRMTMSYHGTPGIRYGYVLELVSTISDIEIKGAKLDGPSDIDC